MSSGLIKSHVSINCDCDSRQHTEHFLSSLFNQKSSLLPRIAAVFVGSFDLISNYQTELYKNDNIQDSIRFVGRQCDVEVR